jgi:integrase
MVATLPVLTISRARLARAWDIFNEIHCPELARKTRTEYAAAIAMALAALPEPFTAADVIRWHRGGLVPRYSLAYANQTLHVVRGVVRRAGILTGDQELVTVVWTAQPIRENPVPLTAPPPDLVTRSLALCRTPAERLFVRLAGIAGLRRGEIIGLQAGDWDPSTGILRVVRQRRSDRRKNRRPHRVEVTDAAFRADLEWAIAHHEELRARTGWWRNPRAPWLLPWSLRRVETLVDRLRHGLPAGYIPRGRGAHLYRHWGATMLARRGGSVWDVMRWLGDSSTKMAAWYVDTYGAANCDAIGALSATAVLGTLEQVAQGRALTPAPGLNPSSQPARSVCETAGCGDPTKRTPHG